MGVKVVMYLRTFISWCRSGSNMYNTSFLFKKRIMAVHILLLRIYNFKFVGSASGNSPLCHSIQLLWLLLRVSVAVPTFRTLWAMLLDHVKIHASSHVYQPGHSFVSYLAVVALALFNLFTVPPVLPSCRNPPGFSHHLSKSRGSKWPSSCEAPYPSPDAFKRGKEISKLLTASLWYCGKTNAPCARLLHEKPFFRF